MESLQRERTYLKIRGRRHKMSEPEPPPTSRHRRRSASSSPDSSAGSAESGDQKKAKKQTKLLGPTKAETSILPPFPGLSPDHIHIPTTRVECQNAVDEILAARTGGFDTEAKPTFRKGQKCDGPHVVQRATDDFRTFLRCHEAHVETIFAVGWSETIRS